MSGPTPGRPILKLKLPKARFDALSVPKVSTPKITLKLGGKPKAPPIQDPQAKVSKKPRKQPPNVPLLKKRESFSQSKESARPSPGLKLKISAPKKTPNTPFIRLKPRRKPLPRPPGVGYDSEASDCEEDPAIEEEFILRMLPGDDCEYIRKAIEEKTWGPKSQGGADIKLRFLRADGRRAVLIIRGRVYAAILVDLPCIVEGMKSFDRRAWWKTADICQMLLVLGIVSTEAEASEFKLPPTEVDPESWAYAHGITPPMRWVRKRRFRNRVSARTIEAVEEEVGRLLALDAEAIGDSKYETIDLEDLNRPVQAQTQSEDSQDDAEGEMDDFFGVPAHGEEDDDDDGLEADLEKAMLANEDDEMEMHATDPPAVAPDHQQHTDSEMGTPAAQTESRDESDDDESGSDEDQGIDEAVMEQQADLKRQREEIADLQAAIQGQTAEYERLQNNILKQKKMQKIQSLRADLALKQAAIGENEDD